jgi:hypothetical protein
LRCPPSASASSRARRRETTNAVEATIASGYALVETSDKVAAIDALDTGVRGGPEPASINPGTFPYKVEND